LGQKREEEYRHLGIGDVHEDAARVQPTPTELFAAVSLERGGTCPKSLNGEVKQI
jgi:uncharacterized protein YceH (UPF0502 family)